MIYITWLFKKKKKKLPYWLRVSGSWIRWSFKWNFGNCLSLEYIKILTNNVLSHTQLIVRLFKRTNRSYLCCLSIFGSASKTTKLWFWSKSFFCVDKFYLWSQEWSLKIRYCLGIFCSATQKVFFISWGSMLLTHNDPYGLDLFSNIYGRLSLTYRWP